MCELCLDSREGDACKRPEHAMLRSPRRGEGKPSRGPRPKRHILAPEALGRGREGEAVASTARKRSRRVYGSQNQHMHAPLLSAQVTSSSSYLSFFSMQQHPTQPTIEATQKMIATMKRAGTGRDDVELDVLPDRPLPHEPELVEHDAELARARRRGRRRRRGCCFGVAHLVRV